MLAAGRDMGGLESALPYAACCSVTRIEVFLHDATAPTGRLLQGHTTGPDA